MKKKQQPEKGKPKISKELEKILEVIRGNGREPKQTITIGDEKVMIHYIREINYNIITSEQATRILSSIRRGAGDTSTNIGNEEQYEAIRERFRNQKSIQMKIQVQGEEMGSTRGKN